MMNSFKRWWHLKILHHYVDGYYKKVNKTEKWLVVCSCFKTWESSKEFE